MLQEINRINRINRGMGEVVQEVDSLMDRKKLTFNEDDYSSSDKNESSQSSQYTSDSEDDEEEKRKKKKRKDKKKKKSRKEKKLTSYVKFPQKWPHSHLKLHFLSKNKKYDDLSLAEFCAGYMSILKNCKQSHKEARIAHLEELMYHATTKPWKNILNYHAACLLEIERGNLKWGDNFQLQGIQNTTLYSSSNFRGSASGGDNVRGDNEKGSSGKEERVCFCRNFQRGTCTFTRDHYGQLNGENHLLKHICAKCWLTLRKQSPHSEESNTCPLFNVEL